MRSTWLWRYSDEPASALSAISKDLIRSNTRYFFDPIHDDVDWSISKYLARNSGWISNEPELQSYQNDPHVVVMDFSWSFTKNTRQAGRPHVAIAHAYCAPEYKFPVHQLTQTGIIGDENYEKGRYHGDLEDIYGDISEAGDIWAMGSTILELVGGGIPYGSGSWNPAEKAMKIDPHIPEGWERIEDFSKAIDKFKGDLKPVSEEFWAQKLAHMIKVSQRKSTEETKGAHFPAIDVTVFPPAIELARYILRVDPRLRPSAADVVKYLPDSVEHTGKFRSD